MESNVLLFTNDAIYFDNFTQPVTCKKYPLRYDCFAFVSAMLCVQMAPLLPDHRTHGDQPRRCLLSVVRGVIGIFSVTYIKIVIQNIRQLCTFHCDDILRHKVKVAQKYSTEQCIDILEWLC